MMSVGVQWNVGFVTVAPFLVVVRNVSLVEKENVVVEPLDQLIDELPRVAAAATTSGDECEKSRQARSMHAVSPLYDVAVRVQRMSTGGHLVVKFGECRKLTRDFPVRIVTESE